jgi:hypothetical protein
VASQGRCPAFKEGGGLSARESVGQGAEGAEGEEGGKEEGGPFGPKDGGRERCEQDQKAAGEEIRAGGKVQNERPAATPAVKWTANAPMFSRSAISVNCFAKIGIILLTLQG